MMLQNAMEMEAECQTFFALGKRVPKDVKRFCGICRQHGVLEETRGHVCKFKDCTCDKCQLVRTRRQIMSQQIRLRRAQDKRFQRTNEPNKADVVPIKLVNEKLTSFIASTKTSSISLPASSDELLSDVKNVYFCQKCKNHNILQHKRQCPFMNCVCEKCELIETRRRLDQHIKKRRASMKAAALAINHKNVSPKIKQTDTIDSHPVQPIYEGAENLNQQEPTSFPQLQFVTSTMPFIIPQICVPNDIFSTVETTTPFGLNQADLLTMAMVNMNSQLIASNPYGVPFQCNQGDMSQLTKMFTPKISPIQAAIEMPIQQPQMSMKEIEQLLILKYQMQQVIHV